MLARESTWWKNDQISVLTWSNYVRGIKILLLSELLSRQNLGSEWLLINKKMKKLNYIHVLSLKDVWHKTFKSSWELRLREDTNPCWSSLTVIGSN